MSNDSLCNFATINDAHQFVYSHANMLEGSPTREADEEAVARHLFAHSGEGRTIGDVLCEALVSIGWDRNDAEKFVR